MENMVIFSTYDGGYCCSIMVKGEMLEYRCDEFNEINKKYGCYGNEGFVTFIFERYKCDLLICEDGGIEFYKYSEVK